MMPVALLSILAIVLSYVLGSMPTGLWLGLRFCNIDIREHGSKNIGATNTIRTLGKKLGSIAMICDIAKGAIPVLLFAHMADWPHLPLACGMAAILGHTFSIFLKFKGGKGIATSAGVFLALTPKPLLVALIIFLSVIALSRMVSAGSVCAATTLGIAVFCFDYSLPIRIVTCLVALLVIFKHRSNISRILKGEESKIFTKSA